MGKLYLKGLTALGKCVVAGAKVRELPDSIPEYPEEEPVPVNSLPAPMQSPKAAAPTAISSNPTNKKPWQMTQKEYIATGTLRGRREAGQYTLKSNHYQAVKNALQYGDPVPPEVLADYPDLAAKFKTIIPPAAKLPNPGVTMPTTVETVLELKRRLAKEIYRMELDLLGGGRIAGKPCDCLDMKHHFGIEATAEELIAMDHNPAYQGTLAWLKAHQEEFTPSEIEKHPPEYYQGLVPELRRFRKAILGTELAEKEADCQPCMAKANAIKDLALKVKAGELTMEDAKAKVREMA